MVDGDVTEPVATGVTTDGTAGGAVVASVGGDLTFGSGSGGKTFEVEDTGWVVEIRALDPSESLTLSLNQQQQRMASVKVSVTFVLAWQQGHQRKRDPCED